jgi:predicted DNA-binding transcriptional regulator AlpA
MPPEIEPLLLRAKSAAAMCGVSVRTWNYWRTAGKTPPSFKLGGCVVWKAEHIRLWVKLDMPKVDRFIELLQSKEARR